MRRFGLIAALAVAACGDDGITVNQVDAEGSVGGIIVDAATRAPLAGVEISLLAGGEAFDPVTTADDGTFAFDGVPAGGVIVTLAAPAGYESAWLRGELPAAAGEYPAGNSTLTLGPLGLVPTTGQFTLRVLDGDGAPVSGYQLAVQTFAQYIDFASGVADAGGEVLRAATTDADGYATFLGMPDFAALGPSVPDGVVVVLPPRDANADGIYEFGGGDRVFNLRALTDPTPDVVLQGGFEGALAVRASTIDALVPGGGDGPSRIQRNGTIFVKFNLPIRADVDVAIGDEDGDPLAAQPAIGIRDDTLTISFAGAQLEQGAEYNLHIHAVAAAGDRTITGDFPASFFTVPGASTVSVAGATRDGAQNVFITFSEPVGGITTGLGGTNCVLFFQVDLDGTGGIGNAASELGAGSCGVTLSSNEPNPPGPVGTSGYSTRWVFNAPLVLGTNPIPQNTPVHVVFSRVATTNAVMLRTDGTPANDLMFLMPP